MTQQIKRLAEHNYRLIVIPQQKLTSPVSDIKTITYGDVVFEVIEFVRVSKTEPIPVSLKLLSIGELPSDEEIWKAYSNSEKIYFFIVCKNDKRRQSTA